MDLLVVCSCGHSITSHSDAVAAGRCSGERSSCTCKRSTQAVLDAAVAEARTEWAAQWDALRTVGSGRQAD